METLLSTQDKVIGILTSELQLHFFAGTDDCLFLRSCHPKDRLFLMYNSDEQKLALISIQRVNETFFYEWYQNVASDEWWFMGEAVMIKPERIDLANALEGLQKELGLDDCFGMLCTAQVTSKNVLLVNMSDQTIPATDVDKNNAYVATKLSSACHLQSTTPS